MKLSLGARGVWIGIALLCIVVELLPVAVGHGGALHDDDEEDAAGPDSAPHAKLDLRSSRLMRSKGLALLVFFLVPFISCFIPFFVRIGEWVLVYGSLFGAGLFFALGLEHLLADSAEGFSSLAPNKHYPFAYLLVVAGYLFTQLADLTVQAIWARHENAQAKVEGVQGSPAKLQCCQNKAARAPVVADEEAAEEGRATQQYCSDEGCKCSDARACRCGQGGYGVSEADQYSKLETHGHSHGAHSVHGIPFVDLLVLAVALCFHGVFEGLAVGLSSTTKSVWNTTGTVVVHKVFEGFALGVSLLLQRPGRSLLSMTPLAFAFSIAGPVGIAIGMVLDRVVEPRAAAWVESVGNGLAAGVFIFVAVSHLMVRAFRSGKGDKWPVPFLKWAAVVLGAATTSLIMWWTVSVG